MQPLLAERNIMHGCRGIFWSTLWVEQAGWNRVLCSQLQECLVLGMVDVVKGLNKFY